MKKLTGRDWLSIAAVLSLIGISLLGSARGKGQHVPADGRHMPIYDALKSGRTQAETELICTTCHSKSSVPLPKDHPPKEQCLICHLLVDAKH